MSCSLAVRSSFNSSALKGGGFRPIAVGEVLQCLASRLCCFAVSPSLPGVFLPYGQVGVGIPGGLGSCYSCHSPLHLTKCFWLHLCSSCLKIDMKNAFNECSHQAFFACIDDDFPEISVWVKWCYSQPAELQFGSRHIHASSGVQQGDSLGRLLFSLVLMQFIDSVKHDFVKFHLWYLHWFSIFIAGTFEYFYLSWTAVWSALKSVKVWIVLAIWWFFPTNIKSVGKGLELLGSPILGTAEFFDQFLSSCLVKVEAAQARISILEDLQVKFHLLWSF